MEVPGQEPGQDGDAGREQGRDGEAQEADDDGVGDDVGHEPEEQLHHQPEDDVEEDHAPLAELVGYVGEQEAAQGQTSPEAGGDVTDLARGAVAYRDEKFNHPTYVEMVS